MAGNIKGITIEFRGDTTSLDKSLRQVDKETRGIDSELKKVDKGLKFNPTSVELWRQKQTLLKDKIKETAERLKTLKDAQKQMDAKGVDKNSKEYRELQREIVTTESKLKNFKNQLRNLGSPKLQALGAQMKSVGGKITAAGQSMRTVSRYAAVFTAGIGALTYKSGKLADDLNTMSKIYHINTKQLQLYGAAAKLVDTDVETIAKSHTKLTKNMSNARDGSEKQAEAFKKLGVNITNSDGSLRSADDVFNDVIGALGQMTNETERDALAMTLMGKSASELNPLIEDGGETYKNVSETMKKYGLDFIDQKTLDNANEFNNQIDTIKAIGALAFQQLGMAMAGYLAPAMEKITGLIGQVAGWLSKIDPEILTVITLISGGLAVLSPLLIVIGMLVSSIGTITTALGSIGGVLTVLTGPIGLIVAGIAALVAAFAIAYKSSSSFRSAVGEIGSMLVSTFTPVVQSAVKMVKQLWKIIVDTATSVGNTLATALKTMMPLLKLIASFMAGRLKASFTVITVAVKLLSAAIKGIAIVFAGVVQKVAGLVNSIKSKFNAVAKAFKGMFSGGVKPPHIPLPHFAIKPSGWKIGDLVKGKIPSLSVNWYASGGIFNSPSVIGVGEGTSPEAVVPLDKLWDAISQINGGIIININGYDKDKNELAQAIKQELINEVKRRRLAWQ